VVAEAQRRLDFRDPHSFSLLKALPVDCPGVDHIDFSADGSYLVATCEFSAKLVKVDLRSRAVVGYLKLAGSSPQDIKLDAAGQVFCVADRTRGWVHEIKCRDIPGDRIPAHRQGRPRPLSQSRRAVALRHQSWFRDGHRDRLGHPPPCGHVADPRGSPDMGGVSAEGRALALRSLRRSGVRDLDP
jgi:hypothetical protein